ncbi:MAG: hypothetical protein ABR503_10505 [Chitinophagaceae bacterium]
MLDFSQSAFKIIRQTYQGVHDIAALEKSKKWTLKPVARLPLMVISKTLKNSGNYYKHRYTSVIDISSYRDKY